jgi:hypothetical protein
MDMGLSELHMTIEVELCMLPTVLDKIMFHF